MKKYYLTLTPMTLSAILMMSQAYANHTIFDDVIIMGRLGSLTQGTIDSAKESVKTIPGGASIVDLNQVREGRQSTWSDSLGMAPSYSRSFWL